MTLAKRSLSVNYHLFIYNQTTIIMSAETQNEKITIWIDNGDKKAEFHTKTPCCDTNSTLDGSLAAANELSLYAGHKSLPLITAFFKSFNVQNIDASKEVRKKANLGTILGVYLPTIQHIFGAIMFLRLFWIVGIMGIGQCIAMTFLCMLCTFLTCISLSAIATNGVIEGGGTYFMISRNLGPEFGTAVGVLFYLGNACACAMYIVAAVEVFLLYIAPNMTIGGQEVHDDTDLIKVYCYFDELKGLTGMMSNNYRVYGTVILLLIFAVVALGVRFVQFFAPISLICVLISITAIFAGVIEKSIVADNHHVCYLDGQLLQASAYVPINKTMDDQCFYCNFDNPRLRGEICQSSNITKLYSCDNHTLTCGKAFLGIQADVFLANLDSHYMQQGEVASEQYVTNKQMEIFQDITTTFFVVMAIYFPSVTGIMTGANMSGDLEDPQKSIPQGTISAQLTTSLIYFLLILAFGSSITGPVLRDKYGQSITGSGMVVAELAWPSPWIIMIGAFTSCFGAALQCLCSAPRLLQSIAKDDVLPFLRSFQVLTRWNEPFRCVILTTLIAELAILMAALDRIAPIVDFFFLMCYAFINLACFLHSILGAPNWRPRFKCYHWTLSLLGTLLCLFIMFSTHWFYALCVTLLCGIIYKYVSWKGDKKEWGDGMTGLILSTAQFSLSKLEDKQPHPKNWRPQLLLVTNLPMADDWRQKETTRKLISLASQLKKGRGLTVAIALHEGQSTDKNTKMIAEQMKKELQEEMTIAKVHGFCSSLIYEADQLEGALSTLIQSCGIGPLRPNTLLIPYPEESHVESAYWYFLHRLQRGAMQDMSLIVLKGIPYFPENEYRIAGNIDMWWILHDGGLLLLVSFLLKQHKVWRNCHLRIFVVVAHNDNKSQMRHDMGKFLYEMRIDADLFVCFCFSIHPNGKSIVPQHTFQVKSQTEMAYVPENAADNSEHLSFNPMPVTHSKSSNLENGRHEGKFRCERKFTFSSLETTTKNSTVQESPTISSNQLGGHLPEQRVIREVHSAVRLNRKILEKSSASALIVLNLPEPPKKESALSNYMEFLNVLTHNLRRVLLVRGSGSEVITKYS
uniref:Solute carrier family 12 member 6 n=1 Tax=Setaria digitata TaxID=48799 RepID=A0A915Q144_9BILA